MSPFSGYFINEQLALTACSQRVEVAQRNEHRQRLVAALQAQRRADRSALRAQRRADQAALRFRLLAG